MQCQSFISMAVLVAFGLLSASIADDSGSCLQDGESSLLQVSAREQTDTQYESDAAACSTAEGEIPKLGCAWGKGLWWMPQAVSALFYRPHYDCTEAPGTTNVRKWLESVMQGTVNGDGDALPQPDFLGLSEMESIKGLPGGSYGEYNGYKVIGAVCGGYRDPIALYYRTKHWKLIESYPASPKCRQHPPFPAEGNAFTCASDQAAPTEDNCCVCTYSDNLVNQGFYSGAKILWPDNGTSDTSTDLIGDRPFVIGKFENRVSKRKVCAVTFNLPHQLLANCSVEVSAACFSNAAGNAFRIGTAQLTKAINEVCAQTPLIFFGDTNNGAGTYETGFMFYNPYNPDVASNAKKCPQPAPLLHLRDPPSDLWIRGQPYTCCFENGAQNDYASDRVAASGPSWASLGGYFNPKTILGGARRAGLPIAAPSSLGVYASCPGVAKDVRGYPCCGAPTEHAPVWGFFDLFR